VPNPYTSTVLEHATTAPRDPPDDAVSGWDTTGRDRGQALSTSSAAPLHRSGTGTDASSGRSRTNTQP
jgi:hypothetical protein